MTSHYFFYWYFLSVMFQTLCCSSFQILAIKRVHIRTNMELLLLNVASLKQNPLTHAFCNRKSNIATLLGIIYTIVM